MKSLICLVLGIALPLQAGPWYDGGDLSALGRMEELGGRFTNEKGKRRNALEALKDSGANCVRLRLFVEPNGRGFTNNDIPYTLALAKRAKKAGQAVLLDFHYSNSWADPAKQWAPKAWEKDDLAALEKRVEDYTFETLKRFEKKGVLPELVQIGNEIDPGLIWPVGRIWKEEGKADWDSPAALLRAAARGVRRATPPDKSIRIVIHTATGGLVKKTATFHREMQKRNVDYDVAGLSYYPWWHGTVGDLAANCRQLATDFDKEVLVVETAYDWRPVRGEPEGIFHNFKWPNTPEGQLAFLRDVIEAVHSTPDQKGIGVIWWHPDSIQIDGARTWKGGNCALWRPDGSALPALSAFSLH